ncbi:hypothetical protein LUZ63_014520 [Rhynchospora breviuscula]|uniref:Uncharacterized protein n=1 Tax=Rhynchospora breviuscula TaxID=2022672 RepID=A0A9Q0CAV1_9POAL|nr:hypothetical protein LUZ63_014520 [Rhynchospora breviuscula]
MGAHQSLWRERGHQAMDKMGINKLYDRYFVRKEIKQFEEFHVAFIDLFRDFTSIFPGTRYNVPTSDEIEEFYTEWKNLEKEEQKKAQFCDFMNENIVFSDTHHNATLVTGIVAPTAAVIVKNTWKNTPILNIIPLHHIPTFIFVPSFTMLSLIGINVVHILE